MEPKTILELVKNAGEVDVTQGIIEEVVKAVPEIAFFDTALVPGIVYSYLARVKGPTVSFRNIGDPVTASRSKFAKRPGELKLLSGRIELTEAEVKANPLQTLEEQEADEAAQTMIAAFKHVADQIWNGAASDNKGFVGAPDLVAAEMVTRAGDGAEGASTSVWFVCNGAKTACGLHLSKNSKFFEGDLEFHKGDIQTKNGEGQVTGVEPGYIGDLSSWINFGSANTHKLARLCNVTKATGLNDDMLTDCIELFAKMNDGLKPDAIFMSHAARSMLRKSRKLTFTSTKGVDVTQYAPIPADVDGIPLYATNSITDTEDAVPAEESSSSAAA